MSYRNEDCSDCRAITSGDCGKHGPLTVITSMTYPSGVVSFEKSLYCQHCKVVTTNRTAGLWWECLVCGWRQR